jgi:hypothetical protein
MLWWLTQPHVVNGVTVDYWHNRQVPGYPAGTTLASLYQAATAANAYALPSLIDGPGGLDPDSGADANRNRAIMLWYEEVCLHASSYVMQFSVYDVVRGAWPGVKCGNYNESEMDYASEPGNTGWFLDWEHPFLPQGQRGDRVPKQSYPRCSISKLWEGSQMWGVGDATGGKRWIATRPHRTGDVSSPELYKLGDYAFSGHRQPNQYRPLVTVDDCSATGALRHPCETHMECTMRLARHAVESIIESATNGQSGGLENTLVPWVQEAYTQPSGDPDAPPDGTVTEDELEDMLLLFRAKNVPEVLFWTGYNSGVGDSGGTNENQAAVAWKSSKRVADRVYNPRIGSFEVTLGTEPGNASYDPTILEFTLNENHQPRVIELASESLGTGGYGTGAMVKMEGFVFDYNNCPERIKINVESTVDQQDVGGLVLAWGEENGVQRWYIVPQPLEQPGSTYHFWTPKGSDGSYQSRVTCVLFPEDGQEFIDQYGILRLWVLHGSNAGPFVSKFDLVQAVALSPGCPQSSCPTCPSPIPLLKGDLDFDGEITPADLVKYLDKWSSVNFMADINQDDVVDAEDLGIFLTTFGVGH